MKDFLLYTKEISPGRWVAATAVTPYFCFEAESRDALVEIVRRALAFYEGAIDRLETAIQTSREREKATPTFSQKDKISARELVAA